MRFWMRLRSSGSVTSLQSSLLVCCFADDEELWCFLELEEEEEEWCLEDDPEGILEVVTAVSFSVSEPEWDKSSSDSPRFLLDEASGCCGTAGNWDCRGVVCSSVSSTRSWGASVAVIERFAIDSVTPDESGEDM